MSLQTIDAGPKISFVTNASYAMETQVAEGGEVELRIIFDERFSGFETTAVILENNLREGEESGERMEPWAGNYQLVYVDMKEPIYYIRYKKGAIWIGWIAICLLAIAVIVSRWVLYELLRKDDSPLQPILKNFTAALVIFGIGFVIASIGNAIEKTRRTETNVKYGRGIKPV